jgi:hypothetical protein
LISLLSTGALFGLALPASVPVWLAIVVLFFAYGILVAPLKLARRACYWGFGRPGLAAPFFLLDAVVWVAIVTAFLWLAAHHSAELHDAIHSIPALAHQATNDIQTWWKAK